MQFTGLCHSNKPCSKVELFMITRFRLNHLLVRRRLCKVGLASLVLSYWEELKIDRNRPGLLRSELRSRRTLIVEQTNH